jgi:predicted N-formylglutamate amidohydrolase
MPSTPTAELPDSPLAVENEDGKGPFVFVCEHASNRLPDELGTLGLSEEALLSHIAWDIGALDLARRLAQAFDSVLCYQRFSRLVYDCNRPLEAESAIPARSEIYEIPGNRNLSDAERAARHTAIYLPFEDGLAAMLDRRERQGRPSLLVSVHSFAPVYFGKLRSVEIGILHDRDSRFADAMLATVERIDARMRIERNAPYAPKDGVTHTLIEHGIRRGLANAMIEVRNDLLQLDAHRERVIDVLSQMLRGALDVLIGPSMRKNSKGAHAAAERPRC